MNCSLGFDILWEPPSSLPTCVGMKFRKGFKTLSRHNQWGCTVPATCQEFFFLFFFISSPFPTCHSEVTTVSFTLVQARKDPFAHHRSLRIQTDLVVWANKMEQVSWEAPQPWPEGWGDGRTSSTRGQQPMSQLGLCTSAAASRASVFLPAWLLPTCVSGYVSRVTAQFLDCRLRKLF